MVVLESYRLAIRADQAKQMLEKADLVGQVRICKSETPNRANLSSAVILLVQ